MEEERRRRICLGRTCRSGGMKTSCIVHNVDVLFSKLAVSWQYAGSTLAVRLQFACGTLARWQYAGSLNPHAA